MSSGGCKIEGEDDSYDFGSGAGFYVDATEDKWKINYRMYSYVTKEVRSDFQLHYSFYLLFFFSYQKLSTLHLPRKLMLKKHPYLDIGIMTHQNFKMLTN